MGIISKTKEYMLKAAWGVAKSDSDATGSFFDSIKNPTGCFHYIVADAISGKPSNLVGHTTPWLEYASGPFNNYDGQDK